MDAIRALRDGLLANRENWEAACASFAWPVLDEFNWALDWFDGFARGNDAVGLLVVEADGSSRSLTFDELVTRSDQAGELAARAGRRARRPDRADARQPGRAVGDDAGGDEARRGRDPGDDAAGRERPARPDRSRQRQARRGARRRRGQVRRRARRLHADRGRRRRPGRLARLRARRRGADGVRARRADPRERHAAPVLHVRHDRAAQARRAHARVVSGRPPLARSTGSGSSPATST